MDLLELVGRAGVVLQHAKDRIDVSDYTMCLRWLVELRKLLNNQPELKAGDAFEDDEPCNGI